jgi:hypothetical protein
LLRHIWPDLKCAIETWEQLPRPASVKIHQVVDKSFSMDSTAVFGEGDNRKRREDAARRIWAALLVRSLEYGGQPVGVVLYKSTREWIERHCFVPPWITLLHHGSVAGVNTLEQVRALFVVGRALPSAESVTREAEAMTGEFPVEREFQRRPHAGRILIPTREDGSNTILVDTWQHPHPIAERIRRQVTEAGAVQAEGRARSSLRDENSPLDIHRWHDVALPELGEVEPLLWEEVKPGLDGLMFTARQGGVWVENKSHAEQLHPGLVTVEGLKDSRQVARAEGRRGVGGFLVGTPYRETPHSSPFGFTYQLTGSGQKPAKGVSLVGAAEARAFLEMRLGPLARFEVEQAPIEPEATAEAAE